MNVDTILDLLADNDSVVGLGATSIAIVLGAALLRIPLVALAHRRFRTVPYHRYWAGKIVTYLLAAAAALVLVILWAPLGGRLSVILGFATAGLAFAMQEVIGALFGWVNILTGRIYTVGDRVQVGQVSGDVIDITPLRTKVLEIGTGGGSGGSTWVSARQATGRVVTLSNKRTFTEPIYNYSAQLDWIWEELAVVVRQDSDWTDAEAIVLQAIRAYDPAARREGEAALLRLADRYLVAATDVEPRTYVRVVDGDIQILGRFVVRVRAARVAKDAITREILSRFRDVGIALSHPSYSVTVAAPDGSKPSAARGQAPQRWQQ